jgi:hypothetical protein
MKKKLFTSVTALFIGLATYAAANLISFQPIYHENGKMVIYLEVASTIEQQPLDYPLPVNYSYLSITGDTITGDMVMESASDSMMLEMAPGRYIFNVDINHGDDVRQIPVIAALPTVITNLEALKSITTFGKQLTIAGDLFIDKPYSVINTSGQQIKAGTINSAKETVILEQPAGCYIVVVVTDAGQIAKQIFIN